MRLLQTNLGRSRWVQDLFFQTIRENTVALAVVAEPYLVLDVPDWTGDINGSIATMWLSTPGVSASEVPCERVDGYVALE